MKTPEDTGRDGQKYFWLEPEDVPTMAASVRPMPVVVAYSV